MRNPLDTVRFILSHPLNRARPGRALARYLQWQVSSRLASGPIAVPFVNDSRLLVARGMTGATGNIYCGLHEFADMAFLLHCVKPGDRFVDVGANIGSYTVLAAVAGCGDCISVEPAPTTFESLKRNIAINGFQDVVRALNIGIGASTGHLRLTTGLDTVNHVLAETEGGEAVEIEVRPLDDLLGSIEAPTLLKIDVEGFESEVMAGAERTLDSGSVLAVIMELNGSGARYGFDDATLHRTMLGHGFQPMTYEPFARQLASLADRNAADGNTLYVRDVHAVEERLTSAPRFHMWNGSI